MADPGESAQQSFGREEGTGTVVVGGGPGIGCRPTVPPPIHRDAPPPHKPARAHIPSGKGPSRSGASSVVSRPQGPQQPGPVTYVPELPDDDALLKEATNPTGLHFQDLQIGDITYSGPDKPNVIEQLDFYHYGIHPQVLGSIKRLGWFTPTPVQRYSYNVIYKQRDLMACAQTGSGKTGAYLIPIVSGLLQGQIPTGLHGHCEPVVLIVVPTRELAQQIYKTARQLALGTCIHTSVLYGCTSVSWAEDNIKNCTILVATPGRLRHFVHSGFVELRRVTHFILDEADLMLSMGFESDIRELVNTPEMPVRSQRQTLMFSATFPPEIQRLATDFLIRHIFLSVGIVGNANTSITQSFIKVETQPEKKAELKRLMGELLGTEEGTPGPAQRILIFVERRRSADYLGNSLCEWGFPTSTIHGDREQSQREEALKQLNSGFVNVLVATSLAGRGLDFAKIDVVINYDLPQTIEEYIHRIGRTGRVGHLGKAVSFYCGSFDRVMAPDILKILKMSYQEVPDWLLNEAREFELQSGLNLVDEDPNEVWANDGKE